MPHDVFSLCQEIKQLLSQEEKGVPLEKNIWLFSVLGETVSNLSEFKRDKHLLTQALVKLS